MEQRTYKTEEQAAAQLGQLYRRYGYTPYKMNQFEEYELYVGNKDFLLSDKIITFSDDTGRLLALKPDVTLSIVKNAPQEPGVVQKVYYKESVFRDYRELLQTGLECVGDLAEYEIAEVVLLAAKSLQLLGGRYVLNLSHMGLVAQILKGSGLTGAQQRPVPHGPGGPDFERQRPYRGAAAPGGGLPAAEKSPRPGKPVRRQLSGI